MAFCFNFSTFLLLLLKAQLCLKALSDIPRPQDKMVAEEKRLDQAEELLGDHLTGGVVQGWRQVQRKLGIQVQGEAEWRGGNLTRSGVDPVHTGCMLVKQVRRVPALTTTSSWLDWRRSCGRVRSSCDCSSNSCRYFTLDCDPLSSLGPEYKLL